MVEIFQENVSFDHYFGTYPHAANSDGVNFKALPHTPAVDGLPPATSSSLPPSLRHSTNLLTSNPNSAPPRRLDSSAVGLAGNAGGQLTCDQDHNYSDEQKSFDGGLMDKFVESVGTGGGNTPVRDAVQQGNGDGLLRRQHRHRALELRPALRDERQLLRDHVRPLGPRRDQPRLREHRQRRHAHEANSPSVATSTSPNADLTADGKGGFSLTSDAQPYWDDCSTRDAVALNGKNIGDQLNAAGLSWGWFQGGFRPTTTFADGAGSDRQHRPVDRAPSSPTSSRRPNSRQAVPHASNQGLCNAVTPGRRSRSAATGQWGYKDDYIAHHEPFQYYASTANPHHLTVPATPPAATSSPASRTIGTDTQSYVGGVPQFDTPNHNYDMSDFDQLVTAISNHELPASALPAVSFLKAPGFQDGHAAYSDPAGRAGIRRPHDQRDA